MELNINKLIQVAEELCFDGKIQMAEKGIAPVQDFILPDGTKYQLQIIITAIEEEIIEFPEE